MAAILRNNFESRTASSSVTNDDGTFKFEGGVSSSFFSLDTTTKLCGSVSLKIDSGAGGTAPKTSIRFANQAAGTTVFARAYMRFENLANSQCTVFIIGNSAANHIAAARLGTNGKFSLWYLDDEAGATQVGSESVLVVTAGNGIWYRVELSAKVAGANADAVALRVSANDGPTEEVASGTGLEISGTAIDRVGYGFDTDPGANKVMRINALAVNSDAGANPTSWVGPSRVTTLFPVSDNSIGGWTGGSGGGTSPPTTLWQAVDNTPPTGTASETDTTQIENAVNSTTDNYDANMTSYTSAGVPVNSKILVAQAICVHGEDIDTGTKTGAITIVSNPAQSGEDTFTFGEDLGALGTWPSNWRAKWGTAQVNPTVTLATQPVMRVGKRSGGNRVTSVCYMAINVEYTEPGPELLGPGSLAASRQTHQLLVQ